VSAEAYGPHTAHSTAETTDFCLSPEEIAKGEQAAEAYLETVKPGDPRRSAEEALDTLAAVISGGVCSGLRFPWHQVRAYHGALALSIVKESGAPAHIEALRCRHDDTRKYQQVAESFKPKEVQRMRTSLEGVLAECWNLGFISDDEMERAVRPRKRANGSKRSNGGKQAAGTRKSPRERELTEGEVRALLAACDMDDSVSGSRDALMIGLAWHGRLKTVDLINLSLDDLGFSQRTGHSTIRHKAPGAKRARRIPLQNEDLIAREDWLEARGREPGPLFCPIQRGQVDRKRMTAALVREFCEQRAEQAGVLPFAPNDLARSSPHAGDNARRKRSRTQGEDAGADAVSPLYEDARDDAFAEETEHISFPYRVRVGR